MILSELLVRVGADLSGLSDLGGQIAGKLERAGDAMQRAGATMTKAITLPVLAAGGAALKASIDFESAFAGVRKTVTASDADLAALRSGIIQMSKEIPASAVAIAGVAEAAGQLGIETGSILDFTRVMIDLGETTNMSADEAATQLARLANITGMNQQDFDRLGSTVVALGNKLATTEGEIVTMGLRLAGAGSQIGLTEAQILAFAGALSSVGVEAEAGGTAFSKLFIDMANSVATGKGNLAGFAAVAGMTATQFQTAFQTDAAGAILAFITGLGNMADAGGNVFAVLEGLGITEVRMRDALLRTAGASDLVANSLRIGTAAWESNTALTNEAAERYNTTAARLSMLWNRMVDVARVIGDVLVPMMMRLLAALDPVFQKVEQVAQAFADAEPKTQLLVVGLSMLAAGIGPALMGLGLFAKALGVVGAGLALVTSPVALTVAGIAALAAGAYLIYKNWEGITAWFARLWDSVATIFSAYMDLLLEIIKSLWPRARGQFLTGIAGLMGPLGRFADWLGADALAQSIGVFGDALTNLVPEEAIAESEARLDELTKQIAGGFVDVYLQGSSVATDAAAGIANAFNSTLDAMLSAANRLLTPAGPPTAAAPGAAPMVGMTPLALGGAPFAIPTIGMEQLAKVSDAAKAQMSNLMRELQAKKEAFAELTAQIGAVIFEGMVDAISTLAEGFGQMAAGTASLGDVGRNLLGVFAGVMMKLGKLIIAYGLAAAGFHAAGGFAAFLNPLSAPVIIGIGAALMASGAAIKGYLSSKSGGGGGGGTRAGGVTSVGVNANGGALRGGAGYGGGVANQAVDITPRALPSGDLAFATAQAHKKAGRQGTPMH